MGRTNNLLVSPGIETAHIEFTSRCNLRCVFCSSSQPGYKGRDMDSGVLDDIAGILKKKKVKKAVVNGNGETTIYKDWNRYCNTMLDAGIPLHIISNFSKEFSREELNTLARFESIEISCDSSDPKLFGQMRRGADLNTVTSNIFRLREKTGTGSGPVPRLSLSCVVSDINVMAMKEYVKFAASLGVDSINFCNLIKYPDIKGIQNPRPVMEMPADRLPGAENILREAFGYLKERNIGFNVQQGLLDGLAEKIKSSKVKSLNVPPVHGKPEPPSAAPAIEPDAVQTRDCLDPWRFVFVRADGAVLPCCWHKPVFFQAGRQSLEYALNSVIFKELRKSLLTGNLPLDCRNCPSRGWTTTGKLREKVWAYINRGRHGLFAWKKPKMTGDEAKELKLDYMDGWYGLETGTDPRDSEWKSWRWTAKKAVCKTGNPKREAVLVLRGGVDKALLDDQLIGVTLNNRQLDVFVPAAAKFSKEYVLSPAILGKGNDITLSFEINKTFVPASINAAGNDDRELGFQVYRLSLFLR